jgi:sRNA-binding protein
VENLETGVGIEEEAIASDPWEEEYPATMVDATGSEKLAHVSSQSPTHTVENAPQAAGTVADEETPQTVTPQPTQTSIKVAEESTQLRVSDRVNIQAGGKFDGKNATVFDCSNLDEVGVTLDQAEGGHELWFPATYLVHIEAETR